MSIVRKKYSDDLSLLNFGTVKLVLFVMEGEGRAFPNRDESKGNLCWPQAFPAANSRHRNSLNSFCKFSKPFHIASPQTTALLLEAPTNNAQEAPMLCFFSSCLADISLRTLFCSMAVLHPFHVSSTAGRADLFSTQGWGKTLSPGQGKAAEFSSLVLFVSLAPDLSRSQCSISLR